MRTPITVDHEKVKQAFEKQTGIPASLVEEVSDAFPASLHVCVQTATRTFYCLVTITGRVKKRSFHEEK